MVKSAKKVAKSAKLKNGWSKRIKKRINSTKKLLCVSIFIKKEGSLNMINKKVKLFTDYLQISAFFQKILYFCSMENQEINNNPTVCKTPRWQMLKAHINNLNPVQFKEKIAIEKEVILIDVRTPEEHAVNPLANSLNINYLGDGFWEKIEALDTNKIYLVYCRTGRRSLRACTLMKNGGFNKDKVFNLDGGMVAWEAVFGI